MRSDNAHTLLALAIMPVLLLSAGCGSGSSGGGEAAVDIWNLTVVDPISLELVDMRFEVTRDGEDLTLTTLDAEGFDTTATLIGNEVHFDIGEADPATIAALEAMHLKVSGNRLVGFILGDEMFAQAWGGINEPAGAMPAVEGEPEGTYNAVITPIEGTESDGEVYLIEGPESNDLIILFDEGGVGGEGYHIGSTLFSPLYDGAELIGIVAAWYDPDSSSFAGTVLSIGGLATISGERTSVVLPKLRADG